jgi:uncharacterized protein YbjT (DUF2867 family)
MSERLPGAAFVAGATGYTGREVVRELRRQGIETVAHVRPDSSSLERWRREFGETGARVDTTPWGPAPITATLSAIRPGLVFALLGTTRARARRARRVDGGQVRSGQGELQSESYQSVDYGLTRILLDATLGAAPGARVVYLSSMGVSEGSRNPYIAVRARMERELRESGLSYLIARPGLITGPDREESRPAERIAAAVSDGVLALAAALGGGNLQRRYASMDAATLARGLVRAALGSDSNRVIDSAELRG